MIKIIAASLLLLLLSACVAKQPKPTLDPTKGLPLSKLEHWQLTARIAIKTADDNLTASLNWQKNHKLFDFLVSGAFGVTYAHLIQEEDQATLEIPDTDLLTHSNAEFLLHQTLGWDFPLNELSYWVKGLPSGNSEEQIHYDEQGKIKQIHMGLWKIDFSKHKHYQGYLLPKMIKVEHPDMSMKVVAKKWLFLN